MLSLTSVQFDDSDHFVSDIKLKQNLRKSVIIQCFSNTKLGREKWVFQVIGGH